MLPRLTDLKPASVNATSYVPGLKSMIRYWPELSVTTDRVLSISAGLDASTSTPGMTAPDVSLTTPVIAAWALLVAGTSNTAAIRTARHSTTRRIWFPLFVFDFVSANLVIGSAPDSLVNVAEPHITGGLRLCQDRRVTDRPVGHLPIQQFGRGREVAAGGDARALHHQR